MSDAGHGRRMTSQYLFTSDFHREFEAETARLFRRRFFWFLVTLGCLYVLLFLAGGFGLLAALRMESERGFLERAVEVLPGGVWSLWGFIALSVLDVCVYVGLLTYFLRSRVGESRLLVIAHWYIVYLGIASVASDFLTGSLDVPVAFGFFHLVACVFLPWTPRQAMRPLVIPLALNAALVAAGPAHVVAKILFVAFSPAAGAPGLFVSWLRHTRRMRSFKMRFLQSRYGQMRKELVDARRIHESLFPLPRSAGAVRFDYRYEPMLQIGGDYLYAKFIAGADPDRPDLNVVLIDVTGHGVAAALTVNRFFGEIERIFGEDPSAGPGDVLRALNRYVHLTLADHSVYATAFCARIDQVRDRLEYASGGHPPGLLRGADGTLEELPSTAMILGACGDGAFDCATRSVRFGPGDLLLLYTDGATESRDAQGRMLRYDGLLRIVAGLGRGGGSGLAARVLDRIDAYREGPPSDDTIIVEVERVIVLTGEEGGDGRRVRSGATQSAPVRG